MRNRHLGAALRRDMVYVGNAIIAVVFIGFVSLALASAVIDLMALNH